jgi:RHS repeat-associated protein
MGYVLPGWMDEILDFIGINWPNVDEDDYREMADAMREFADGFEGHGAQAHQSVSRILASSEGWAVDSLQEYWGKVKGSHLDEIPELARLFANACDVVADIIFGMKTKAEIELGAMAASIGLSIGLAVVTGGLSALVGAAETAAMRQLIRRIIKEAEEEIVDRLLAEVTEPITGKLEKMTEDMIFDVVNDAISLPTGGGSGGDGSHGGGKGGMTLDSAHGHGGGHGGGGGGGKMRIDTAEFDNGADKLSRHGEDMGSSGSSALGRTKNAFGRARGRDPFTQAFDGVLHGAINGVDKALKKVVRHLSHAVPNGIRTMSTNHKRNEQSIVDNLKSIDPKADGHGPRGGHGVDGAKKWNAPGSKIKLSGSKLSQWARAARCKLFGGDPIDMATGEMFQSQKDLILPGVLPLVVERTHISSYRHGHFFGPSWTSTFDERLERGDGGLWWHRTDGSSMIYDREPDMLGDEVWPVEGERIPLTCVMEGDHYALAVADPRSGLTRHFRETSKGAPGVWWLAEVEDRNGNGLSIDREADGTPTAIRHDAGYHVEVSTDDRLVHSIAVRTPDGPVQVMRYGYDAERDLTDVINSSGLPLKFGYDGEHRITSWTDRNDSTFQYVYDEQGRVVRTVGPDGYLSSHLEFDADEHTTRYTDSLGAVTAYRMNERGQVIAETDPLGHTTHSEWDRHDNLLARTDPLGHTTRYTYDDTGNLTAVQFADNTTARTRYNRLHLPVETTLSGGEVWHQEYDARGNRTSITAPDNVTTRFTYDENGAVTSVADALGRIHRRINDPAGLPLAVTDPAGNGTAVDRDPFGNAIVVINAVGARTEMEWTPEGNLRRRVLPDGSVETWQWDAEGNCLSHVDPAGAVTTFEYTHFDLLASRTGPDGALYRFLYDTELRLVEVRNPHALSWNYAFDKCGRLTSEADFDDRVLTYAYDAAGRLSSRCTPLGERISYDHDCMGRTLTKDVESRRTEYTYDLSGRMVTAASPSSSVAFNWDMRGRLIAETVDGATTTYAYDAVGRRSRRTTPTGAVSTFTYDLAGNRTSLATGGHTLDFAYDAVGREIKRAFGDAVALTSDWDPLSRLTHQGLRTGDRAQRSRAYSYRPDSYLTSITDEITGSVQRMDLDPVGRPLQVSAERWTESYAYDQSGNQTEATWPGQAAARGERTYTGTRIQTAGSVRYEHDAAGRMTLRQKTRLSRKPDTWRYEWDAEDHLTACTTPDGTRWTYTYDPLGRRTAKFRLDEDGNPAEAVYFSWDGTRLAEEHDTTTGVTLTWDHEGHRPLTQYERKHLSQDQVDSRFFAIVTDLVGTPTELVDESGHIAWHARATLWGATTWNRDATAYTPLRFPGQYADPETGLHFNFHRHYDPDIGRYACPDPLGLIPAPNPWAYVNNPHTWCDPLGLMPASGAEGSDIKKELMDLAKARVTHVQGNLGDDDLTPGAYSVGKDRTSGKVYYGESGPEDGHAKAVVDAMPDESQHPSGRPPGVCAEPRMFTNAIKDGADPQNLDLVTVNTKGKKFKMCDNCKTWVPDFGGEVHTG